MWKTLKRETLLDTYHVAVRKDAVQLPDGAVIDDFYTVTIPHRTKAQADALLQEYADAAKTKEEG